MTNETTASQTTTCGACGANEGERCRTMSDDRCDAGKHVTSQPKEPHWIDGEQSSLGGKTAREGYAANPEYAGLYPAASQPKSIGDDAQGEIRKVHHLKTDPEVFDAVARGDKTHEIRMNDRDFQVGDRLVLAETESTGAAMRSAPKLYPLVYTGRTESRIVSHIQTGYGLADGWCILSFRAPAAQASATIQAAPSDEAILVARAEGRAEVVRMILQMDAETPLEEFTGWGNSGAPDDEGSAYWKADELRAHFSCDDKLFNLFDRAEGMYWEALGRSGEAERMCRMVTNAATYQPLHDFLAKHEAWDLMHSLMSTAATIQEPVMVAEPVDDGLPPEVQKLFDQLRPEIDYWCTRRRESNLAALDAIEFRFKVSQARTLRLERAAKVAVSTTHAAPMVADPAGVVVPDLSKLARFKATSGYYDRTVALENHSAGDLVKFADIAALAATVKAVPSEALEIAVKACERVQERVVESNGGPANNDDWSTLDEGIYAGAGYCIGELRRTDFAAPLADKTGGGE